MVPKTHKQQSDPLPPALVRDSIEDSIVPQDVCITPETSKREIVTQDVQLINMTGAYLMAAWNQAASIKSVCSLAKATISFIKARRDVMELPYGAKTGPTQRADIVYPLD